MQKTLILAAVCLTACGGAELLDSAANPNAEASCAIPAGAGLEDTSSPRTVIGDGTAASCTSAAVASRTNAPKRISRRMMTPG